jgi:excisionase family DNA binding protein
MTDRLLTSDQAARLLGISARQLRRWAKQQRVPHLRIAPRIIRYEAEALLSFLDQWRVVPNHEHQ